jgi:flagellar biosynthesis protein FliR
MNAALLTADSFELGVAPLWTFFLILTRIVTLLYVLPGIGTEQVPIQFRLYLALSISVIVSISIPQIPMPDSAHAVVLALLAEFLFGMVLSLLPSIVIGGLAVSGQVVAGVIGLAQANMMDRSLGESVSVLARFNMLLGTLVFLAINGHHVLLKAVTMELGNPKPGVFTSFTTAIETLTIAFSASFELAITIAAPILIATLISQFLLGLITKFVPQVNIFIISLPLSIFMGLYIMGFTIQPFNNLLVNEFRLLEEYAGVIVFSKE